ncbi:hypothetical protein FRC12_016705 [Ceratobasidium sp. 428]|nr:hypothetical protein FRC12_016705 [Ceratobasidium sp. 428]
MSRVPSPCPSTSSETSTSEEDRMKMMNELIERAERACRANTATDEVRDDELLTLTGEDELPNAALYRN